VLLIAWINLDIKEYLDLNCFHKLSIYQIMIEFSLSEQYFLDAMVDEEKTSKRCTFLIN
jgi:hypothetical protein